LQIASRSKETFVAKQRHSMARKNKSAAADHPGEAQPPADSPVANFTDQGKAEIPAQLPVLPLRGTVMYPGTIMPLNVGRPASRRLLDECLPKSKIIALATQHDSEQEEPTPDSMYNVAVAVMVLKLIRQPDETVSIIVHGLDRIHLTEYVGSKPYMVARVQPITETPGRGRDFDARIAQIKDQARQLIELSTGAPEQALTVLMNIEDPSNLADFLAANLDLDVEQKQDLLEEFDVARRLRVVHEHVSKQLQIMQLQHKIQQEVQSSISDTQHKFYLREQMKAIQRELGEDDSGGAEIIERLRKALEDARPPEAVLAEAHRDLRRLESIPPASPEYAMILSYLELLSELPWQKSSEDHLDLDRARKILDRDHHDLEKVKRRLIEYLAVLKLNPQGHGPILCLVGPPGVGKTSLGQSVADALGRKFVRMSLGGIRDEAEIRGHRRTYIGAMPGRIIQEIRRAGTRNPIMMLDEVDKLGADFRGDPSSALLEVLDPRQNNAFVDRYLDVPFDLSRVLFIATANYMGSVPPALQDRMEVIDIPGYTDYDKLEIARRYLVPRQLKENGLSRAKCTWKVSALRKVINDYTREAGVRELERQIGAVCRGVAAKVAEKRNSRKHTVDPAMVHQLLGPEKFVREELTRTNLPGVVMALAYTPVGGEVLFIEATSYPGKGNVTLTGQIGEVMKESASAALSLFKTRAPDFDYDTQRLAKRDLHIHVPAGAVPKDGPSAGVAMYAAIASLLLDVPMKPAVAMSGEITLRGRVLPVGGIKEKSLAASRIGIRTIILPKHNERDMEEVHPIVRDKCKFIFVKTVNEVLEYALGRSAIQTAARRNKRASKTVT